ncbi:MAG: LPS-assembly protein LptD [Alphaproteobacteria bacterium]|nr:LPS-assembly protein LptD [Alphaproteobacteria bacterium]MBL0718245.1 LPS-assembly protein LptD [Alphaproteobacteria bacterium]
MSVESYRHNIFIFIICLSLPHLSLANNSAIQILAEEITYNSQSNLVSSSTPIQGSKGTTTFTASSVDINPDTSEIIMQNISVTDSNQLNMKADSATFSQKNNSIIMKPLTLSLYALDAKVQAKSISKTEDITSLNDAVYTPCNTDKGKCPFWSISLSKFNLSDDSSSSLKHTTFYIKSIPVFYLPWARLPKSTVTNSTGLLVPDYKVNDNIGTMIFFPFHKVWSDYHDTTFTPVLMSNDRFMIQLNDRWNFKHGESKTFISVLDNSRNNDVEETYRWNIDNTENFRINDTLQLLLNINRTSDQTYLRRYYDQRDPYLESSIDLNAYGEQTFFNISVQDFQDLRLPTDETKVLDTIPQFSYARQTSAVVDTLHFKYFIHGQELSFKDEVEKTKRIVSWVDLIYPTILPGGQKLTTSLRLRGDTYSFQQSEFYNNSVHDGTRSRWQPTASILWEYPLIASYDSFSYILTPKIEGIITPKVNDDQWVDTDSKNFYLSQMNLFGMQRFQGYDLIDDSSRINYGLDWRGWTHNNSSIKLFVGQSYSFDDMADRLNNEMFWSEGSSNWVAHEAITFNNWVSLFNTMLLENNSMEINFSETTIRLGNTDQYIDLSHIFNQQFDEDRDVNEVSSNLYGKLGKNWFAGLGARYSMLEHKARYYQMLLSYENDCAKFSIGMKNTFTSDRDYEANTEFYFNFILRTFGSKYQNADTRRFKKHSGSF